MTEQRREAFERLQHFIDEARNTAAAWYADGPDEKDPQRSEVLRQQLYAAQQAAREVMGH